jgi:hypothetical protein
MYITKKLLWLAWRYVQFNLLYEGELIWMGLVDDCADPTL